MLDGEQCQKFIDQNLEMVREQSWLDGAVVRAMTLVRNDRHPSRVELSLGVTAVGAAGVVATKAVKKWGAKAGTSAADQRTRRSSTEERLGSPKTFKAVQASVLETEWISAELRPELCRYLLYNETDICSEQGLLMATVLCAGVWVHQSPTRSQVVCDHSSVALDPSLLTHTHQRHTESNSHVTFLK